MSIKIAHEETLIGQGNQLEELLQKTSLYPQDGQRIRQRTYKAEEE